MTTWVVVIVGIVLGLSLSAFFSGSETGLYSVSRVRLHVAARQGNRLARVTERLLADEPGSIASILIGNNIANYLLTSAVAILFTDCIGLTKWQSEVYTIAVLTPIVFVLGEVVPKNIFHVYADGLMLRVGWLLAGFCAACRWTGLVSLFRVFSTVVSRLVGGSNPILVARAKPKRRIAALISDAVVSDESGAEHSGLVKRVVELSETPVHTVMVPQNRVISISARADRRELIRLVRRHGFSKLPVHDTGRRHIIGQISVDRLLRGHDWKSVGDKVIPVATVRPHATLAESMTTLQQARRELAIVTDRGGRLLGIVTMADLLEWLVGGAEKSA
ncbi:MAG: DUF21 domain-containing protein [Phycisphaerae bacterium]|nr:DUF21 domain-containing protein [Phycisphaerae bacterium]